MSSQTRAAAFTANRTDLGSQNWADVNPSKALASDNQYSTSAAASVSDVLTYYLTFTQCGFSIPTGATITDISVTFERKSDHSRVKDYRIELVYGGIPGSANQASATLWPTTDGTATYAGAPVAYWGAGGGFVTPAVVNATDFGFSVAARIVGGDGVEVETASVDYGEITITYTDPAALDMPPVPEQVLIHPRKKPTPHFQQYAANVQPPQVTVYNLPPVFQGQTIRRRYRPMGGS